WADRTPGRRVLRGVQQDISEIARVRDRLREAQSQYRFLFEHNPLPMCVYHRTTLAILAVNNALVRHYGYQRDEMLAANMMDIRPPEEAQAARDLLLSTTIPYPQGHVWTHARKDGTRMRMMAFGDEIKFDGHPARLVVLHDVTASEAAQNRFQVIARATTDAIWDWEIGTDSLWWSDSYYALFGDRDADTPGSIRAWETRVHPDDLQRVDASLEAAIASGASAWEATYRFRRKDGEYADVFDRGFLLRDSVGRAYRAIGGMLDVTQKHRDEADLRLLRRAVESTDNGILIADARQPGLPAVYVNRAFERMTGYSAEEIIGSTFRLMEDGVDQQPELEAIRQAIAAPREVQVRLRDTRKNGEPYWRDLHLAPVLDDAGILTHFVSVQSDVTEHQRVLAQLAYRATYDDLTGLPNRQLLHDRLQQAIRNAERLQTAVAVLFIDLDNFKLINDSLGHSAGDDALRILAERFGRAVGSNETLARFGGDEFVAVLTDQVDEAAVGRVLARIGGALAQPLQVGDAQHYMTASIGYCRFPEAGSDAETLLKHADIAMYQAKRQGRNQTVAYRADFDASVTERLQLISALRDALRRDEFRLVFQPLFDRDGAAVGMEALVRWQHPERGLLVPGQFIGICEDSGLIVPLGRWVLQEAARHHAKLTALGLGHLRIAVNVSAEQFGQTLQADVQHAMNLHRLPHGALELELTESVIMATPDSAIDTMRELDSLGVSLSVDDFGTGYSSLAYLKRLPIDRLKIDRSFVSDLGNGGDDDVICATIIQLAHSLGLQTVAEGVETEQQLDWLRARDCDELQGFHLAMPMSFEDTVHSLRNPAVTWPPVRLH
ncbi:MAG: EAL domain-containing protein, partial [Dokdonella sp.]